MKSVIVLTGVLSAPGLAHADGKLLVQVPASLDPSAPIGDSVKRECGVESLVGNHVFQKVRERVPETGQIEDVTKAGADKVLKLTLLSVHGAGGGGWSGPKSITIRADVSQNQQVIESKVFQRQSSGGAFGGLKGTCSIMERIAVALGQDVGRWVPGALLGQKVPTTETVPAVDPATVDPQKRAPAEPTASEQKQ